jgi:putative transposase
VKRSVLVEADGGPLAIVIAGANVHDTKLLAATLDAIVVTRPQPTPEQPQHLCLDKAYDNPTGEEAVAAHGYVPHIRRIGEEKLDPATGEKRYPARRWVVERCFAWLSRNRRMARDYERKVQTSETFIDIAASHLVVRRLAADMTRRIECRA